MCRYPALNIKGDPQQDDAQDKGDDDIVRGPTMRRMCPVCNCEDDENEGGHRREQPPKVHLHLDILALLLSITMSAPPRETENGTQPTQEDDDGPEPEVPPPGEKVARDSADNDTQVEAQRGKRAIEAKNEILAGAGPVGLAEDHDARREEGSGAEPLHGAGDDEHGVVLAEARDEGPDEEPGEAHVEDEITTNDVGHATKGKEEGTRHEGEDTGGPYLGADGDM